MYGRMILPTSLGELTLDSGARMLVLFRAASSPGDSAMIRTAAGLIAQVSVSRPPELRIGDRVYSVSTAAFGGTLASNGAEGLLPASTFGSIFICNSKGYVVIDPDNGR
jgi:hypothetical protein